MVSSDLSNFCSRPVRFEASPSLPPSSRSLPSGPEPCFSRARWHLGEGMVAMASLVSLLRRSRETLIDSKACCDPTPGRDPGASSRWFHVLGISSRIKLATLAWLRCRRKCDRNRFRSLFPTFFFSKKINILLFLCILVFSHSSSSVFYFDPRRGRGALLCHVSDSGSLPSL